MNVPIRRSPQAQEERRLARDLRRQHPRAVERVVARYGVLIRGFLNGMLGDRGEAEDVLQLTLIDVWQRGPTYDSARASLPTWLLMIARSRAIDHLRHRVPTPYDPNVIPEAIEGSSEDSPDVLIEQWRMAALISTLPRAEATILEMRFYQGYSQSEIAEQIGIPLGTVKMRMVQALDRLRESIDREPPIS